MVAVVAAVMWLGPAAPSAAPLRAEAPRRVKAKPIRDVGPGVVSLAGQVVVMEGDSEIVTDYGGGAFGIEDMQGIGQRFYMHYPDEFDAITVFTTFGDMAQGGAAYALLLNHGFSGAGYPGGAAASQFGSTGRLMSVTNMNDVGQYQNMDEFDTFFTSVMGQEFGHSWLAFVTFIDPVSGSESNELLGRDGSHWSALFDSDGSVMDGLDWVDNGDGTFTAGQYSVRYGPLDLWAMGVYKDDEVGDMYVLRNAVYADNDQPVGVLDHLSGTASFGRVVRADKAVFTIDDVIAAGGPRMPAWDASNEDFRMAFILVTKPGQTAADVQAQIDKLNRGRITWENTHREWTYDRSTMCTDVEALCPLAFAQITDAVVSEDADDSDNDGIIEPGERIRLDVTFTNEGSEPATTAVAELTTTAAGVELPEAETLPEIPVGGSITHTFYLTIKGEACGNTVDLQVTSRIDHRVWTGQAFFQPGVQDDVEPERFATSGAGWVGNPGGSDDVVTGAWEYGVPDATYFAGRELQPNGGADGNGDGAWFTGPHDDWDTGEVQGTTTLQSDLYDLSRVFQPSLRYKVWYVALNRTSSSLTNSPMDHLVVEASDDGGATWVEVDRVGNDRLQWDTREVPLGDKIASTDQVRFRFTVSDDQNADTRLVEVGIDDVSIISLSDSCNDDGGGGCGCNMDPTRGAATGWLLLLFGTVLLLRRRRHS